LKKLVIVMAPFLFCSSGVFLFTANAMQLRSHYRMATYPAIADAFITGKTPENHNHVTYRFEINGRTIKNEGAVGDAYDTIAVGDKVRVIYDAKNPGVSVIFDPDRPYQWNLANPSDVFFQMLLLSSIFALIGGAMFSIPLSMFVLRRKLI
jgi:Protein of unknown function (DUF3592)